MSIMSLLKKQKELKIEAAKKQKEEQIEAARAEIKTMFRAFLEGEGKLPEGFSAPYNRTTRYGYLLQGTPFEAYLDEIRKSVDSLRDETGISDWLHLDGSVEINAAAAAIADWANRHRNMNCLLQEKCHIGNTTIMVPVSTYCTGAIMVVVDDRSKFENITEQSAEICKAAGISFCTVLSDRRLYDLTEQKEKELTYVTYPNYHDETYANWTFCEVNG